jgi:hypothetical protein
MRRKGAARGGVGRGGKERESSKWIREMRGKNVPKVKDTDAGPLRPAHCLHSYHDTAPREAVETKGVNTRRGYEERRAESDKRWRDDLRRSVVVYRIYPHPLACGREGSLRCCTVVPRGGCIRIVVRTE